MRSMEHRLERILTVCLGGFWLLDGILQLQSAMFTSAFVNTVLSPNLQNQPSFIAHIIAFGINIFTINTFWFNLASAFLQLLIGASLLLPLRDTAHRFALWLSVTWALIIWIFGEGFGNLATGSATFYTGAPGSALLYLILALFLLYASKGWLFNKLPLVAGVFFLVGAALNLTPMFWQPTMLSMLATVPAASGPLGTLGAQGTLIGNLLAIDMLACLGIFLIVLPNRSVAWVTIIFLVIVWWIGQNFGGLLTFPGGTATDPNSAPLFILFLMPIFFVERHRQPDKL
jgi:hypothetical protein